MAKTTTEKLLETVEEMSVIELSEFLKAFEEKFDVILTGAGDKKIQVIKEVRGLTSLGLKEAKELVDNAPSPIIEGADKETAEKAKEALEGAGGSVELK